ncbi:globin domain-containing protein [Salinactinospora qingdaonensis]|uniref:nitric oxide dioxygenase n=1 Tax=Salinactinospora qingdaonensis TaxID=702744 RepID=A0ABP7FI85_9ACTN
MPLNSRLIEETFAYIDNDRERAIGYFYGRLFAANPGVRSMFPPAMDVQRDRLFTALTAIVRNLDNAETLNSFLSHLGRDHRKFGVEPHHYEAVGSALVATLRRFAAPAWSQEAERAWLAAYQLAARMMIEAAEEHSAWAPPWWHADVIGLERPQRHLARLTLRPNQGYSYLPGQYLMLQAARWPRVWRPYSIANAPQSDNLLHLLVRAVPGGWVSGALVHHTRLGDSVLLGPPLGSMVLDAASDRPLVCVAGGTGIAPLKAIIEQVASLPRRRPVTLFYGAAHSGDLTEKPTLDRLQSANPWLRVVSVLESTAATDSSPGAAALSGDVRCGRVPDAIAAFGPFHEHDAYVCGPPAMMRSAITQLRAAGVRRSRIFHDLLPDEDGGYLRSAEADEGAGTGSAHGRLDRSPL